MHKELDREKKLNIWREVVEKAGSKKEFWAFVGSRTKGERKKNIPSLKSEECLDSNFDAKWKEEVESNVSRYSGMSDLCEDEFLDKEIEKGRIVKCIRKFKNNKISR